MYRFFLFTSGHVPVEDEDYLSQVPIEGKIFSAGSYRTYAFRVVVRTRAYVTLYSKGICPICPSPRARHIGHMSFVL